MFLLSTLICNYPMLAIAVYPHCKGCHRIDELLNCQLQNVQFALDHNCYQKPVKSAVTRKGKLTRKLSYYRIMAEKKTKRLPYIRKKIPCFFAVYSGTSLNAPSQERTVSI